MMNPKYFMHCWQTKWGKGHVPASKGHKRPETVTSLLYKALVNDELVSHTAQRRSSHRPNNEP